MIAFGLHCSQLCAQVDSILVDSSSTNLPAKITEVETEFFFNPVIDQKEAEAKLYLEKGELLSQYSTHAAVLHYEKALTIYKELGDAVELHSLHGQLASAYYNLLDYENALKYNFLLLAEYQTRGDTFRVAQIHSALGSIYAGQKKMELAFEHEHKALDYAKLLKSQRGIAALSNNIGGSYHKAGQLDSAFKYLGEALKINLETENKHWLSINYSVYADIYEDLALYDSVRHYIFMSKELVDEVGNAMDSIATFRKIGIYFFNVDSNSKAIEYFNKGILLARRVGSLRSEGNLNHWLSEVYENAGNMDLALVHLREYQDFMDSLSSQQNKQEVEALRIMYEVGELETNLNKTSIEKKEAEQEIERKRIQFYALWAIIVSLIVFGIVVFLQKRKQARINLHLLKMNMKEETPQATAEKYSTSKLSDDKRQLILNRLVEMMVDEQIYQDQNIKLDMVADRLEVSRTYLSQIINETYSQNFSAFINSYRIILAKKFLVDEQYEAYSIQGVAETVGFKSLSAFNAAFKKNTGLTPSYYRKKGTELKK